MLNKIKQIIIFLLCKSKSFLLARNKMPTDPPHSVCRKSWSANECVSPHARCSGRSRCSLLITPVIHGPDHWRFCAQCSWDQMQTYWFPWLFECPFVAKLKTIFAWFLAGKKARKFLLLFSYLMEISYFARISFLNTCPNAWKQKRPCCGICEVGQEMYFPGW